MKRMVLVTCLLVIAGCGTAGGVPGATDSRTTVRGDGPYAVGADIEPGVWTTSGHDPCGGFSAKTRDFDINASRDPDDFITGSVQVGDLQRIVLHRGEFFFSKACAVWARDDSPNRAADPATTEGGCAILVGDDDLVQQTLDVGHLPAGERDVGTLSELQNRLFALVVAGNKSLGDAAGQLVDYLDDPDGYNLGTGTIPKVEAAVAKISKVCGRG